MNRRKALLGLGAASASLALLLCGVLTCRAHFNGGGIEAEIREMASALYDRVVHPSVLACLVRFS